MNKPRILVIGDSCNDIFIYGNCTRLCPDAPVPVLIPEETKQTLGMAGNVFENLKALDTCVHLIDQKEEINKTRYVHKRTNQMFVRVDTGETKITPLTKERLKLVNWKDYDAVVVSDYNKGFLSTQTMEYISKQHPLTFIDTKKILGAWVNKFTFIKINEVEYHKTIEFLNNMNTLKYKGVQITGEPWREKLIITKGSEGAEYNGVNYSVEATEIKDTTGAGDSFLAAFVYQYVALKEASETDPELHRDLIPLSIKFANAMATKVVQEKGTTVIKKEWGDDFWNMQGSW